MPRRFGLPIALFVAAAFLLSGCTTTTFKTTPELARGTADLRILLMPMDIELSRLSAGGLAEPNAEWTAQAKSHVRASVEKILHARRAALLEYEAPSGATDPLHPHVQLVKLHAAVGSSVLLHKVHPGLRLPDKAETFDWTLGEGVRQLKDDFGADYALFLFMRDSYTSAGRAAAMFLAAAVLGVHIPGGQQVGFASLVDLNTGAIAWFNFLQRGSGDLRTSDQAEETVAALLRELPE